MLNCIIIDDEQFSIEAITKYIHLIPKLNVIGIYTNPQMALENINNTQQIDILFMDIDMPYISGLELAKVLRHMTRKLIFTTSHSKYAFDAFEVEGDAYLLKPFPFAKFSTTINRMFPSYDPVKAKEFSGNRDYFYVKSKEDDLRMIKIPYLDVIAFESAQNYIKIHLIDNRTITAYLTVKDVLGLLEDRGDFYQFHRAFIISTEHVCYIESNTIMMNNNITFTVGETYKDKFHNYLSDKLFKTNRTR